MSIPIESRTRSRTSRRDFLRASGAGLGVAAVPAKAETNREPAKLGGNTWKAVLELDGNRSVTSGSQAALCSALQRGGDLRILTEFVYNEHIDVRSKNTELVREVSDFRVTYLVEDRWAAAIMSLRMPINPPEGFGSRASMSFFMYNQDGRQAIARPYLDGPPAAGRRGPSPVADHSDMPKYHQLDNWDIDTNIFTNLTWINICVYRLCLGSKMFCASGDSITES